MIRIGEFSTLAKTTIKTLRFYDEIDLFKPSFVDSNGYRYYDIEQLNVLQKIIEMRNLDIPIDEIKKILAGGEVLSIFITRLEGLEKQLIQTKENISLIKINIAKAKKGDFMKNNYVAKEITLPKCVVYYRHGTIATMQGLAPFILKSGEEVSKNNPTLKCVKPDYCYVVYGAKEYKETDIEVEYAQAVVNFGKESKNIKFKQLEEQKAISVYHKGSYQSLGKAYAYILNWVKEKGYEICGDIRERYINGCWDRESEDDYLTEIQVPVKI